MTSKVVSKTEVKIVLKELVENNYDGAIGIEPGQSAYAFPRVPCAIVVDMNKVIINYQNVLIVEQTFLRLVTTPRAHQFPAA